MNLKHTPFLALVLMLFVFALSGCGGGSTAESDPEPIDLALNATDIAYDVNELTVPAGQPVRVSLRNEGALVHDFSISTIPLAGEVETVEGMGDDHSMMDDHEAMMEGMHGDSDIHVAAAPDSTGTVEFTPTQAGTYEYFCTVAGHKEAGMVGTLVVTE